MREKENGMYQRESWHAEERGDGKGEEEGGEGERQTCSRWLSLFHAGHRAEATTALYATTRRLRTVMVAAECEAGRHRARIVPVRRDTQAMYPMI